MTLKDWFSRKSPLQLALQRGTAPGGELWEELEPLDEYSIESAADADAICDVLQRVLEPGATVGGDGALNNLIGLFDKVESHDCPAFDVLCERGLPLLTSIIDAAIANPGLYESNELMMVLGVLVLYETPEGTEAVLRAAQKPDLVNWWHTTINRYRPDHPYRDYLFQQLMNPMPARPLALCLLDNANGFHGADHAEAHPFDSPAGAELLESLLTDDDEDNDCDAYTAIIALSFMSHRRDELLALALEHRNCSLQLEAACVAARIGREAGIKWLVRACGDVRLAEQARYRLEELHRTDAIPASEDPTFWPRAHFAHWLAHPNELGHPPDEVEVYDHRWLDWPPDGDRKEVWLLKYRVKDTTGLKEDDVGVGLVGSVTFCLFWHGVEQRPPEDGYALHCFWEMKNADLIADQSIPFGSTELDHLLGKHHLDGIEEARLLTLAEPAACLKYPRQVVALAQARRHGEPGWVVIDGPDSRWYALGELPPNPGNFNVLALHIGRKLLGFTEQPDRRKFLWPPATSRPPEQTIVAYERLLASAEANAKEANTLLGKHSILGKVFPDYVAAVAAVRSRPRTDCVCTTFESLLSAATRWEPTLGNKIFDSWSPLGTNFNDYCDALIERGRRDEIPGLVERFRGDWNHPRGAGILGCAAARGSFDQLAEPLLLQAQRGEENSYIGKESILLAEIWCRAGKLAKAQALLDSGLESLSQRIRANESEAERQELRQEFVDCQAARARLIPSGSDEPRSE